MNLAATYWAIQHVNYATNTKYHVTLYQLIRVIFVVTIVVELTIVNLANKGSFAAQKIE
jgi:uncharacterized membrane protein YwzB